MVTMVISQAQALYPVLLSLASEIMTIQTNAGICYALKSLSDFNINFNPIHFSLFIYA